MTTAVETITLSQAFQRGMSEEMARDDTIFVIGTDLYERGGHFAQVKGLGPTFGVDRVRDLPSQRRQWSRRALGPRSTGCGPSSTSTSSTSCSGLWMKS